MARTLDAIARCDAALVLLDATQGVTRDDQRIINKVIESGCGIVILANKWDLVAAQTPRPSEAGLARALQRLLPFTACAPVLAVSAKTGFQVAQALAKALQVVQACRTGFSDAQLLSILQIVWRRTPPPRGRGRLIRLQQARWIAGRPIRVAITTAPKAVLPPGYQRYLLNQLATHPRCAGLPVQLTVNPVPRQGVHAR
jgi:GTP-binding protein